MSLWLQAPGRQNIFRLRKGDAEQEGTKCNQYQHNNHLHDRINENLPLQPCDGLGFIFLGF